MREAIVAETVTDNDRVCAQMLADNLDRWVIRKYDKKDSGPWFVIDTSTQDLDCDYHGEVYGTYLTYTEARQGWFEAIWRTFSVDFMAYYQKKRAQAMLDATFKADAEMRAEEAKGE